LGATFSIFATACIERHFFGLAPVEQYEGKGSMIIKLCAITRFPFGSRLRPLPQRGNEIRPRLDLP
jgi:hypothetical protein